MMMAELQLARAVGGSKFPFRKVGGVAFPHAEAPAGLALWPRPFAADDQGRFELRGFGADQAIRLLFEDDRFAPQELLIETAAARKPKEVNLSLAPAQRIEGQVVYQDSGKPAAGARIRVTSYRPRPGPEIACTADAEGRFKLNPYPDSYFRVQVAPPSGQPYLNVENRVDWPQGAARRVVEFEGVGVLYPAQGLRPEEARGAARPQRAGVLGGRRLLPPCRAAPPGIPPRGRS
jgi:hypothetical protein